MKINLYSVKDTVTGVYGRLLPSINDKSFERDFGDQVNNKETMYNQHPSNYEVYRLGEIENLTGKIKSYDPVYVCKGSDFVNINQPELVKD